MVSFFLFLALCVTTIGAYFFSTHLSDSLKRYSFALSICSIGTFLYVSTFFVKFGMGQKILYAIAFSYFLFEIVKGRISFVKKFLWDHRLSLIFAIGWYGLTVKAQFEDWDEFSWASFVKHLVQVGTYWDTKAAILEQGLRYFPGMSLWESFFVGKDYFSEGSMFFAVGVIFIAALNALLPQQVNWKRFIMVSFLFASIVRWFSVGVSSVYVDGSMGVVLALIMMSLEDVKSDRDFIVPLIMVSFFAVIKETALPLAWLCVFMMFIKIWRDKTFSKTAFKIVFVGFAVTVVNYLLWRNHLASDPDIARFDSSTILTPLLSDLHQLSSKSKAIFHALFTAMYSVPLPQTIFSGSVLEKYFTFFGSYFFWALILLSFFIKIRNRYEYVTGYVIGLFGYTGILAVTFLYFFSEYDGLRLASFDRYIGVYFLAFSIFALKIIIDQEFYKKRAIQAVLGVLVLAYPPALSVAMPLSIRQHSMRVIREEVAEIQNKITQQTDERSSIWLIWQQSNGIHAMIVRYAIAPRKMNVWNWSVGERYSEKDVWTNNITQQRFADILAGYDFVAIGKVDAKFISTYGDFFEETPQNGMLFKKVKLNGHDHLVRFKETIISDGK